MFPPSPKSGDFLLHEWAFLAYHHVMFDPAILIFQNFCLFAQRSSPKKSSGALDMNSVTMLILGAAIVAAIAVIAYYIASNLRKGAVEKEKPTSLADHLATFREAKDEGSMTTQEFTAVKNHLSHKIMNEVKQENTRNEPDDDSPKFIPQ